MARCAHFSRHALARRQDVARCAPVARGPFLRDTGCLPIYLSRKPAARSEPQRESAACRFPGFAVLLTSTTFVLLPACTALGNQHSRSRHPPPQAKPPPPSEAYKHSNPHQLIPWSISKRKCFYTNSGLSCTSHAHLPATRGSKMCGL